MLIQSDFVVSLLTSYGAPARLHTPWQQILFFLFSSTTESVFVHVLLIVRLHCTIDFAIHSEIEDDTATVDCHTAIMVQYLVITTVACRRRTPVGACDMRDIDCQVAKDTSVSTRSEFCWCFIIIAEEDLCAVRCRNGVFACLYEVDQDWGCRRKILAFSNMPRDRVSCVVCLE